MKKLILSLAALTFLFLMSCESESSDLELEPQTIETVETNPVLFTGEFEKEVFPSEGSRISNRLSGCGVTGPNCAFPNQTLTYVYAGSNNVTWTVNSGSISIANGQGTNTVSLSFGSDFSGGVVTAVNSGTPSCTVILEILKCRVTPPPPSCGIDVNGIYELNALGDDDVVFYATTDVSSGWSITGSFFTVTYQDGSISYHVGYANYYGHQQIIIPVNCSNKVRKVEVDVFGENSSNINCTDTRIRDWGNIGVCGTGGFN